MTPPPRGNHSPKVTTTNNLAPILPDVFQQAFFQNQIISFKANAYDSIYRKRPKKKDSWSQGRQRGATATGRKGPMWGEERLLEGLEVAPQLCKLTQTSQNGTIH